MPLKKGGKEAVAYNIRELTRANATKGAGKKRSRRQILAIALAAAKRRKK